MNAGVLNIFLYIISLIILYYVIKCAIKNAFKEKEDDIKSLIKEAAITALKEYEYNKENK